MNKESFEKTWKLSLIIILIIGIAFLVSEIKDLNREGLQCKSNPLIYGAINLKENYKVSPSCSCFVANISFTFNEEGVKVT